jgi:capsid protein
MQEIKDSADLWDASIKAAENKQKLSTYITTPRPTDLIPALGGIDSDSKAKTATSENGQVSYLGDIPDGAMMMLPPDSTINAVQTNGNTDLDTLFLRNNRYISAGIGGPMEIFFKDFSRVNFSSGKLAYDQFFREVDAWNAYNAEAIAEVYNWIMIEAVTRDMLSVQEYREGSIEDLQFIGAQTYVDADPGRNSGAEERRLSNNLVTQTEILAQKGKSYEDLIRTKARQIMIENAVALEEGVDPSLLRPQQSFDNEIMMEESIDE